MARRVLPDHWPALLFLCIAAWGTPVHAPGLLLPPGEAVSLPVPGSYSGARPRLGRRHGRSTPAALLRPGEALAALGAWAAVGALWCAAGAQHCASSVSSANAKRWLRTEERASDTPQHWQEPESAISQSAVFLDWQPGNRDRNLRFCSTSGHQLTPYLEMLSLVLEGL